MTGGRTAQAVVASQTVFDGDCCSEGLSQGEGVDEGFAGTPPEVRCHGMGGITDEYVTAIGVGSQRGKLEEGAAVDLGVLDGVEDPCDVWVPVAVKPVQQLRGAQLGLVVVEQLGPDAGEPVGGVRVLRGDAENPAPSPGLANATCATRCSAAKRYGAQGEGNGIGLYGCPDDAVDAVGADDDVGV